MGIAKSVMTAHGKELSRQAYVVSNSTIKKLMLQLAF
jgi:hypothetical protein